MIRSSYGWRLVERVMEPLELEGREAESLRWVGIVPTLVPELVAAALAAELRRVAPSNVGSSPAIVAPT